jgi:lipopolysaccharide/colanic/teichoic acid biosynthesis glycosyltransferase
MRFVGRRLHLLKPTQHFSAQADDLMIRQFLKPGSSDWAQDNGYNGKMTDLLHIKRGDDDLLCAGNGRL